jgi:hypothetical protein
MQGGGFSSRNRQVGNNEKGQTGQTLDVGPICSLRLMPAHIPGCAHSAGIDASALSCIGSPAVAMAG